MSMNVSRTFQIGEFFCCSLKRLGAAFEVIMHQMFISISISIQYQPDKSDENKKISIWG